MIKENFTLKIIFIIQILSIISKYSIRSILQVKHKSTHLV